MPSCRSRAHTSSPNLALERRVLAPTIDLCRQIDGSAVETPSKLLNAQLDSVADAATHEVGELEVWSPSFRRRPAPWRRERGLPGLPVRVAARHPPPSLVSRLRSRDGGDRQAPGFHRLGDGESGETGPRRQSAGARSFRRAVGAGSRRWRLCPGSATVDRPCPERRSAGRPARPRPENRRRPAPA